MSIIRDIDQDPEKQKIISNLVNYSRERGIQVIAEGVETVEELHTLLKLDVDFLQGFLLSRPAEVPEHVSNLTLQHIRAFHAANRKK